MNKLPPAIYGYLLFLLMPVIAVTMAVLMPIILSVKNRGVWGLWPVLLVIVVVCFIVYRFCRRKVSNNKPKDEQDNK